MESDLIALTRTYEGLWLPQAERIGDRVRLAVRMIGTKTGPYRSEVARLARNAMRGAAPLSGFVSVWIHVYGRGVPKNRFDVDNVAKATLDGLTGAVFRDDRQVVNLYVRKRRSSRDLTIVTVKCRDIEFQPLETVN